MSVQIFSPSLLSVSCTNILRKFIQEISLSIGTASSFIGPTPQSLAAMWSRVHRLLYLLSCTVLGLLVRFSVLQYQCNSRIKIERCGYPATATTNLDSHVLVISFSDYAFQSSLL
ncbi:hypothetical protein L1887_11547 [Cichorium endivia]|nr:hypothetical protein L1887_11547 [Cichorium endivia]